MKIPTRITITLYHPPKRMIQWCFLRSKQREAADIWRHRCRLALANAANLDSETHSPRQRGLNGLERRCSPPYGPLTRAGVKSPCSSPFRPPLFTHSFWRVVLAIHSIGVYQAFGQDDAQAETNPSSLWNMIEQGGWAMAPLGICSLALIYLIIHCSRETKATRFGTERFSERIESLCKSGKLDEAISAAKQEPALLGRALSLAFDKFDPDAEAIDRGKLDETVHEQFELEEHAVGQWIHYINVIATVSPMIGLLGTVSGMIGAFQTMSAGGMGRPELLAGNIGEALITTATGLCIGIPAMIAHSYFSNRLNNRLVENTQRANAVSECLETLL